MECVNGCRQQSQSPGDPRAAALELARQSRRHTLSQRRPLDRLGTSADALIKRLAERVFPLAVERGLDQVSGIASEHGHQ